MNSNIVMEYRQANPPDGPAIAALWQTVFGDGEEFIRLCLDSFAGPGRVFVAVDGGGAVAAQLLAAPCSLAKIDGCYLYALATAPEYRNAGVMSALMRYAEARLAQSGAAFAALIPASGPLFGWYGRRGYAAEVSFRVIELTRAAFGGLPRPQARDVNFPPLDAELISRCRGRWLSAPLISFPPGQMRIIAADLVTAGAKAAVFNDGYAVFLAEGNRENAALPLPVAELGAKDDTAALNLLYAVCGYAGALESGVRLTLPLSSALFAGQGAVRGAALLKPLLPAAAKMPHSPYLRFALDDVFG